MKKVKISLLIATVLLISSCTKTIDKKINAQDLEEVNQIMMENHKDTPNKGRYIKDNLSTLVGLVELGKKMAVNEDKIPTFSSKIADYSKDYDSIKSVKLENKLNNERLENFVELTGAKTVSINKYKGYLYMNLKFDNQFDKEILYAIINYKYVTEYDTEYFDTKTKLTDKVAKDFKGEVEVTTLEEYNDIANFMYTKVPQDSMKEFLLKGMKVSVTGIVFKDKTELVHQNSDWEYLD